MCPASNSRLLCAHRSMKRTIVVVTVVLAGLAGTQAAAARGWLWGVSCASARACTFGGTAELSTPNGQGKFVTLAAGWRGLRWSAQSTPNPRVPHGLEPENSLDSVSCTSPRACISVGYYDSNRTALPVFPHTRVQPPPFLTLVERWNGTGWSIQRSPNPAARHASVLNGVSCISPTACTAVGEAFNMKFPGPGARRNWVMGETLAERWDGTRWSIQRTPNLAGRTTSTLNSVSCSSPSACTAVGVAFNGGNGGMFPNQGIVPGSKPVTLAEHWDGSNWSIQRTPNRSGTKGSHLSSVSCPTPTACTAVGNFINRTKGGTLAERWNGTSWSLQRTPNPSDGSLKGVSCTSPTACIAVGSYDHARHGFALVEHWNGTKWSIERTPNPSHATDEAWLDGVSCASPTACTAVGNYWFNHGSRFGTLAERWNGTRWSLQHTPNPGGA